MESKTMRKNCNVSKKNNDDNEATIHNQQTNLWNVMRQIAKEEGLLQLWNGTFTSLLFLLCLLNAAACTLDLKSYAQCIEFCNEALEIDDAHPKALYRRGKAHS
eukprot:scaffold2_cov132-Skeletonema_menzelii.AAC.6